jgi:predicted negative regulator of RcsB-dependent stress response
MPKIRDMIWPEMMHTKYGDNYLVHYLNRQKTTRKWFKIITLLFSSGGIFSWSIWQNGVLPVIACGVIALVQLVNLVENQLIHSDNDMEKVADLRNKYNTHFNDLEKLWVDFDAHRLDEHQATEQFYQLRKVGADIESTDNKLNIHKYKSLCNITDTETRNYFNQYHS